MEGFLTPDGTPAHLVIEQLKQKFPKERDRRRREANLDDVPSDGAVPQSVQAALHKDHCAIWRGLFPLSEIQSLADDIDQLITDKTKVNPPRKIRSNEDVLGSAHSQTSVLTQLPRIDSAEMDRGESYWRTVSSYVQLRDPLLTSPAILDFALRPELIRCIGEYLGCLPALVYAKVQRSWANDLPPLDTQLFHADIDAAKVVKVFIYLNDVSINEGPTTVVRGSHVFEKDAPELKLRWSEEEIFDTYGRDSLISFSGKLGDVFLADTAAIHCGMKPVEGDRTVIILTYGVHSEEISTGKLVVPSSYIDEAAPWRRSVLNLLDRAEQQ